MKTPRELVSMASGLVRSSSEAQIWLLHDEAGSWEEQARALSEVHLEKMKALGLSEPEIEEAIAGQLALEALRAVLAIEKKARGRG